MRLRRESLLLLVLLTTLCLLVGMVAGIQSGKWVTTVPQASPTSPRAAPTDVVAHSITTVAAQFLQPTVIADQMAVLFVGVSDANSLQPKLEGCWLVAFSPGTNQYYVLSFPPEARFHLSSLGSTMTLADIYTQDVQQVVGYRFVRDAIQSVLPGMAVQADVTLDRSDLADLASKVGGVSIGGELLAGGALATAYDTQSFNGAVARMEFQREVFQALFQALADQHWSPASVAMYLEKLPRAVRPADAAALTKLAANAPSLQSSELRWNVVGGVHEAATVP
jgi:anionic cell wall polymer biosynthesis LytR-Cps2A-Psr (LCP) family protein